MTNIKPKLELYDCTLREGEQAAGASFSLDERVKLFEMLDDFGFDYIELGWPVVSEEVLKSFEECRKVRKKAKIVAFGSTSISDICEEDSNLNSIIKTGADYACIFGKTLMAHVEKQLKLSADENLEKIRKSIKFLKSRGMKVFYDAEHFFDGFRDNKEYALKTLAAASEAGAERLILCDTNGGNIPSDVEEIIKQTKEELLKNGISTELGIHFHNDCNLALANTLVCLPYIFQVQGTINGIGERVGNLNFSEFLPVYMNKLGNKLDVELKSLKEINEKAFRLSGVDIPENRSFVGDYAFAHKGGVHIDALSKGASYEHDNPLDYGNKSLLILNSLGGRVGVIRVAEQFGYRLDKNNPEVNEKIEKLFKELRNLEQRGYRTGTIPAEQYLLIEKYFGSLQKFFEIERWGVKTRKNEGREESEFFVRCFMEEKKIEKMLKTNGGPIDAAYKTISGILGERYPKIRDLRLVDFHVGIAKSKAEESSVRTTITFEDGERFQTVGVDTNIIQSAIEALEKGFRYYLNKVYQEKAI